MKQRIAIVNHKGGIGKTTTTVNLAGALAEQGQRVLAVDCDAQGDLSALFLENHEQLPYTLADLFTDAGIGARDLIQETRFKGISVLPADRRLNAVDKTHDFVNSPNVTSIADALSEVEADYDIVLLDCPPRSHLSGFAAMVAADHVLVPVQVANFAVRSLASIEEDFRLARQSFKPSITIHYFLSMVSGSSTIQRKNRETLVRALGEENVLATVVPLMSTYSTAINVRRPVVFHKPKTKAADISRDFANELLGVSLAHGNQRAA